jgi:hypothetical protein
MLRQEATTQGVIILPLPIPNCLGLSDVARAKIILCSDPDYRVEEGDFMQFHLTYEEILMGSGRDDMRPDHKQELRRVFHRQLKKLWDTT